MKNKSILIIEDEIGVRENIKTLLEEEKYSVHAAANGKDGHYYGQGNITRFDYLRCNDAAC
jgi:CheY-like chemotaxis protein